MRLRKLFPLLAGVAMTAVACGPAQGGGVAQIFPALRALNQQGAQLAGQAVLHPGGIARVKQPLAQTLKHATAVEHFTQQQGAAVTAGVPVA